MFGKPAKIPTKAEALPGRAERMEIPEKHFVNGHLIDDPFRRVSSARCSAWMFLGRREDVLADAGRADSGQVRGGPRSTRRTARSARA